MNPHYIDYMIRERQREELEACQRRRLLNSAGRQQPGLLHQIGKTFRHTVRRLKEKRVSPERRMHPCFSILNSVARTKGDSH
jgi:hypothetical protein